MDCSCARCRGMDSADPQYGFDRAAVAAVKCLACGAPIGSEPYSLVTLLARFGQMLFVHRRCEEL